MLKSTLLAAAAFVALSGAAHAATLDVILGSLPGEIDSYSTGPALTGNLNPSLAVLTGTSAVVPATFAESGVAAPPAGVLGATYLYVTAGSSATFSLGGSNSFGLTWGSIDPYNTLTLTAANGTSYAITGAEILSGLTNPTNGTTQADVTITDPFSNIISAVLTSSANSFEAANFTGTAGSSAVPLPASALMFGMALAGMALVARRKGIV